MAYQYDFGAVFDYTPVLVKGIGVTVELIAFGAVAGVALGIACAWVRTQGPAWLRAPVAAYVEVIRNTPFLIHLFFVFFRFSQKTSQTQKSIPPSQTTNGQKS